MATLHDTAVMLLLSICEHLSVHFDDGTISIDLDRYFLEESD